MNVSRSRVFFIFILIFIKVNSYEKTLRKIVRSQSKMVHRPFSEMSSPGKNWRNKSLETSDALMFSGASQLRKPVHKVQRSKVSSVLTQMEKSSHGRVPYYLNNKNGIMKNGNMLPTEQRLTRNIIKNSSIPFNEATMNINEIFAESEDTRTKFYNNSYPKQVTIENYYEIPSRTKIKAFAPPKETQAKLEAADEDNIVIIPNDIYSNSSSVHKGVFISNSEMNTKPYIPPNSSNPQGQDISDLDSDRVDYLIQGKPVEAMHVAFSYNTSMNIYTCMSLHKSKADIDAQEKFNFLDIEPEWASKKHYWNSIFDSRYETLMRNSKWPPLKVILIPRTQVNSIWKTTFERGHNETVHRIISNVVKKLQYYSNLTFTWNEVSHLAQWWKTVNTKSRSAFRRLVKQGRLEIAAASWVESDEATAHIFGLVHQFIEGQQWLRNNLNYIPEVAWLTDSVTHSPTVPYLLSASGIYNLVITNVHYSWEEFFAEYQFSDFIWIQNWESDTKTRSKLNSMLEKIGNDRLPKHSVLTHLLPFNSADFRACGPNHSICTDYFNFAKARYNDVFSYKVKENAEMLLEQYSKTGTITPHNTIIAPLGGRSHFEKQAEFDSQYTYYQKLADYVNSNRDIYKATIEFGTAKDYFANIHKTHKSYPTLKGDFVNFADLLNGSPAYWTGYFTSRPWFKILLRRIQASLRSTEILFSFAMNLNSFQGFNATDLFKMLINAREFVARLQDRHVVSGTLTANTIKYIYRQILLTVKDCWYIQEVSASLLSVKPNKIIQSPYLHKHVYRDGEFISLFRTVGPGDQVYVFNSLSHERTEIVELTVRNPNVRIVDHNKKEVTIQINPVWQYNSDNFIRLSKLFYKIIFIISVPPLTLELFRIKETSDSSFSVASIYCSACVEEDLPNEESRFPFVVLPFEPGDVQLESYKHRLIFDEHTGFLKLVVEKTTGIEKSVVIGYSAFRSSDVNSGMHLFHTNVTKPLRDILMPYKIGLKTKVNFIASGPVSTQLTSIYGKLLQSTVKIYNLLNSPLSNAIHVESTVDYEVSPKNREVEMFMSIQTNIGNGNPPELFTDNNGFQYSARLLNISRRIESNMYPMTTMSFIQDHKSRLTVITDHTQGVTALQEGQIVVMLDRRVLFNDGRGTNEGLADSSRTCHHNIILLENFLDSSGHINNNLHLPSLSAIHLANSLDYQLDIFVIDSIKSGLCHYGFLPLVKTSFPCDVSLINYRIHFDKALIHQTPNTALMVLHRQSISCHINYDISLHCNGDPVFSLDKIMNNIIAVYKTNLGGTTTGDLITSLNQANFPPMELATLRIYF